MFNEQYPLHTLIIRKFKASSLYFFALDSVFCISKKIIKKYRLTHSQISKIISDYTSSSEGIVTLQSLIMNSLMKNEHKLFIKEDEDEQCNGFRSRRWYSHGFGFSPHIPRSRSGNFYPALLGLICS